MEMNHDMLDDYLDQEVTVYFNTSQLADNTAHGKLYDYSATGILLELDDQTLAFIPYTAVKMVQMAEQSTWWQRFMASS